MCTCGDIYSCILLSSAGGEGKDELGDGDIGDLDILLRTERAREKKRKEKEGDATEEVRMLSADSVKTYSTSLSLSLSLRKKRMNQETN